jgi:hypothetical protein
MGMYVGDVDLHKVKYLSLNPISNQLGQLPFEIAFA